MAYVRHDGTPRVVPLAFHWTGDQLVMGGPVHAPKVAALRDRPRVAVTIDTSSFPFKVLLMRGDATVDVQDDVTPEYVEATRRYMGDGADTWLAGIRGRPMAQVAVTPDWVAVLDFETRFPSALSA